MNESGVLDEFVKFNQEGLDDFYLDLKSRGLNFKFSQFDQKSFEMDSKGSIDLFVFDFVDINVNTNCNSQ